MLTAAHCFANKLEDGTIVFDEPGKHMKIYLGSNWLYESTATRWIASYQLYPEFNFQTAKHDIAIVRMNEPVGFTVDIQPAELPACNIFSYTNEMAVFMGWGYIGIKGIQPRLNDRLKETSMKISTTRFCSRYNKTIFLCAYDPARTTCIGDSGGPVVLASSGKLIGVLSAGSTHPIFGVDCGKVAKAVRVAYYLDWIEAEKAAGFSDDTFPVHGTVPIHFTSSMIFNIIMLYHCLTAIAF